MELPDFMSLLKRSAANLESWPTPLAATFEALYALTIWECRKVHDIRGRIGKGCALIDLKGAEDGPIPSVPRHCAVQGDDFIVLLARVWYPEYGDTTAFMLGIEYKEEDIDIPPFQDAEQLVQHIGAVESLGPNITVYWGVIKVLKIEGKKLDCNADVGGAMCAAHGNRTLNPLDAVLPAHTLSRLARSMLVANEEYAAELARTPHARIRRAMQAVWALLVRVLRLSR